MVNAKSKQSWSVRECPGITPLSVLPLFSGFTTYFPVLPPLFPFLLPILRNIKAQITVFTVVHDFPVEIVKMFGISFKHGCLYKFRIIFTSWFKRKKLNFSFFWPPEMSCYFSFLNNFEGDFQIPMSLKSRFKVEIH